MHLAKKRRLCPDSDEFQRDVKTQIIKNEARRDLDFENTKEVVTTDILQVPITRDKLVHHNEKERVVRPEMDSKFTTLVRESIHLDSADPHELG